MAYIGSTCMYLVCMATLGSTNAAQRDKRAVPNQVYNVIIDAGSTGSRVRLYDSTHATRPTVLPDYTEFDNYKVEPGISQFREGDLDDVKPYIEGLVDFAKGEIPDTSWSSTPIYLMATAGMRLLMEPRANAILWQIQEVLADPDVSPFLFDANNARILSGEEEGAFAWITANYLSGYFDDPEGQESAGIVEMGGASAQIAFLPDGSVLANKFPVRLAGRNYPLYVHSLLYYGQTTAILWVKEYLYRENQLADLTNPCMVQGDSEMTNITNVAVTFEGASDPEGCMGILNQYVYHVMPYRCNPKPCSIGAVYQPTIPADKQFFALSTYVYNLATLDVLDENGVFTPEMAYGAAVDLCRKNITTLRAEHPDEAKFVGLKCLMGLYIPTLFTKAYGFANDTRQVAAKYDINGQAAGWPLGAVIYESQRSMQTKEPAKAGSHPINGFTFFHVLLVITISICIL